MIIIETPRREKTDVTLSVISMARVWAIVRDMTVFSSVQSILECLAIVRRFAGGRLDGDHVEYFSCNPRIADDMYTARHLWRGLPIKQKSMGML